MNGLRAKSWSAGRSPTPPPLSQSGSSKGPAPRPCWLFLLPCQAPRLPLVACDWWQPFKFEITSNPTRSTSLNPCSCGYIGDPTQECTWGLGMVSRYQKRIPLPGSGQAPARCWIGLRFTATLRPGLRRGVPRVECEELSDDRQGESSAAVRGRVEAAREQKH